MPSNNDQNAAALDRTEHADANTLYCKLFGDTVPKHTCLLRKKELDSRGEFTCVGCSMATFSVS